MASLADLKVTLGADIGPLTRGLSKAQGSVSAFSGAFNQANKVLKRGNNTLAEVDGALEALETSFNNARTSAARLAISAKMTDLGRLRTEMLKTGAAAKQMSRGFSKTQMTVVNFNRVIQDAPFGILGVANNIEPLLLSMQSLRAEAGSGRAAFKQFIRGAFTGPGALITVFSLASTAALVFARRNQGVSSSAKKAQKAIEEQAEMVKKLEDAYNSFNEASIEETYQKEISAIDRILDLKKQDDVLAQQEIENTKRLNNAKTGSIIQDEKLKKSVEEVSKQIGLQRRAIDDIIKGYALEQKSVKDLTGRKAELVNLIKAFNSVSTDEAKLGRFILDQQTKTNKVLQEYEAGLKGSTAAAIKQRDSLEAMIHSFRLLSSEGDSSFVPVITALQEELKKLDITVVDTAVGVSTFTNEAGESVRVFNDILGDIDATGVDKNLANLLKAAKKQLDDLLKTEKRVEDWNRTYTEGIRGSSSATSFLNKELQRIDIPQTFRDDDESIAKFLLNLMPEKVSDNINLVSGSLGALEARLDTLKRSQKNFTEVGSEDYLTLGNQISEIQLILDGYKETTQELTGAQMFFGEVANTFTKSFGKGMANIIVQGEKLNDIFKNLGKLLLSSAIQTGLSLLLTGSTGGKITGGLFGSIFPGLKGKAMGGSVLANTPYMVGEKGPELFTPRTSGSITSNAALMGATASVNLTGEFRVKGTDLVLSLERAKQVISR